MSTYLACNLGIDPFSEQFHAPSGKTLQGVVGHRDGCNTECPGENLYQLLPTLRSAVAGELSRGCNALPAPSGFQVNAGNQGNQLNWELYNPPADRMLIERSSGSPLNWQNLDDVDGQERSYLDAQAPQDEEVWYRIRSLVDGSLSPYSSEVKVNASSSTKERLADRAEPRLVSNPSATQMLKVDGLKDPINMAFISDANGRTVKELRGDRPEWTINGAPLSRGTYWLVIHCGNEWYSLGFEYYL